MKIATIIFLLAIILLSCLVTTREGFRDTYGKCREQGYSKEFCTATPTFGPNWTAPSQTICMCPNGSMGNLVNPSYSSNKSVCACFN